MATLAAAAAPLSLLRKGSLSVAAHATSSSGRLRFYPPAVQVGRQAQLKSQAHTHTERQSAHLRGSAIAISRRAPQVNVATGTAAAGAAATATCRRRSGSMYVAAAVASCQPLESPVGRRVVAVHSRRTAAGSGHGARERARTFGLLSRQHNVGAYPASHCEYAPRAWQQLQPTERRREE